MLFGSVPSLTLDALDFLILAPLLSVASGGYKPSYPSVGLSSHMLVETTGATIYACQDCVQQRAFQHCHD